MIYNSSTGSTDILVWQSVEITTPPTKTTYNIDEAFDPAGMVVSLVFTDGTRIATNAYTVSPATLTLETTAVTLTVSFGGGTKTVTQAVTVQEKKSMSYSGAHTVKEITVGGVTYTQYTITGSGTLTVEGTYNDAAIWLCGGGANGTTPQYSGGPGGAGAYCAQADNQTLHGTYVITIGAASAATSFGDLLSVAAVSGASGGTGGGSSGGEVYWATQYETSERLWYNQGAGDKVAKYPFSDTASFQPHCAGGGGGAYYQRTPSQDFGATGGAGGTNGESGKTGSLVSYSGIGSFYGGSGGSRGGGSGGSSGKSVDASAGGNATFYGSGGGGGGYYEATAIGAATQKKSGGAGYQGIVYIRVPA